jgi:hypothetical protein
MAAVIGDTAVMAVEAVREPSIVLLAVVMGTVKM